MSLINDSSVVHVSVVVPIYNVEAYLAQCIESLVAQTLSNVELILVNDGSTDGSGSIADSYAERYEQIRVYHKKNGGLSDARNFGIERARGEYIGFVDSDDWVEVSMFQDLYDKAIETDADIVVCGGYKHVLDTREVREIQIRGPVDLFGKSIAEQPEIIYASHSLAWNKLFKRSLFFSDSRHRFPLGQWFEDSAVIYNIMADAEKIECVPKQLYNYRFARSDSITSSVSEKVFDIFKSCDSIVGYYRKKGLITSKASRKSCAVLEKVIRNHLIARFDGILEAEDRELAKRYLKTAFAYLDKHFPGWKRRYGVPGNRRHSVRFLSRKNKHLAYLYIYSSPMIKRFLRRAFGVLLESQRNVHKKVDEYRKRRSLKKHGYQLLEDVLDKFRKCEVTVFADFGTLLGFVREGGFMAHDLDLDLGVIATEQQKAVVRAALLRAGYELWREYSHNGKVVEDSYVASFVDGSSIKFDINYYETDSLGSRTWLFFRKPGTIYLPRQRSVVEMRYGPIGGIVNIDVQGHTVPVPVNAERLLAEKYGQSWRTPDKKWIYWESPAAHVLKKRAFYRSGGMENIPSSKLRELQMLQLGILEAVESVLEKYGLRYYLSEGTLLGAVRHQGHIPWDDDIDIAMPREDYDAFLRLPESAWPDGFRVWAHTTDPDYHLPFAKVVSTAPSCYRNTFPKHIKPVFSGPRIDIFPVDRVPSAGGKGMERRYKYIRMLRSILMLKAGYPRSSSLKSRVLAVVSRLVKRETVHRALYRAFTRDNDNVYSVYAVNWGSSYSPAKHCVPIEYYGEPEPLPFENKLRPCPQSHHDMLRKLYGDYMTPPPEHRRGSKFHFLRYHPDLNPAESTIISGVEKEDALPEGRNEETGKAAGYGVTQEAKARTVAG